jgi:hypothetical protein
MIWFAQLALTSDSSKPHGRKKLQSVRDELPRSGNRACLDRIPPPAACPANGISLGSADRSADGTPC